MRCVIWDRFYMCRLIGMRVLVIGLSSAFWLIFELGLSAGLFKASPLVVCNTRFLLSVLLLSGYFGATYLLLLGAAVMRERGNCELCDVTPLLGGVCKELFSLVELLVIIFVSGQLVGPPTLRGSQIGAELQRYAQSTTRHHSGARRQ